MDITITIKAPDLSGAIQSLADAIVAAGCIPVDTNKANISIPKEELVKQVELPPTQADTQTQTTKSNETPPAESTKEELKEEPKIELEQVRAKLGNLSRDGKQAEVKELIKKYAKKLTEIPPEKYAEVMAAAEAL